MRTGSFVLASIAGALVCTAGCAAPPDNQAQTPPWQHAEKGILEGHVQLTFADRFQRAGEAYFSPDQSQIIFQAVEVGQTEEIYGMFVATLERGATGWITGLKDLRRISPHGSANTCGWFHPTEPGVVIFASTIVPPTEEGARPGYQRDTSRYAWMFPPQMKIVRCRLDRADGSSPASLEVIAGDDDDYQAEGSLSDDGRYLLYCSLESAEGDLFVKDLASGTTTRLVHAPGYDGGPFFSPDGRRICYRSDRRQDDYLQLLVAELAIDGQGAITGVQREFQLTDDGHVNWAPYWHPSGRMLVYASSAVGHHNYEVYAVDADPGNLPDSPGPVRYGTQKRRITHADGADVLPVFSPDGRTLLWTSKRGPRQTAQLWAARFVLDIDAPPAHNPPAGGHGH